MELEVVRKVQRGHHCDALDRARLAAVADFTHPELEKGNGVLELGLLVGLASHLVIAAEQRNVETRPPKSALVHRRRLRRAVCPR